MSLDLDEVGAVVEPVVAALGLTVYDVRLTGSGRSRTLQVLVDRSSPDETDDRVDLDTIADASRALSVALDDADVVAGSYLLEVSSPGVERPLRRPDHFRGAVGEDVTVKQRTSEGSRRLRGRLVDADDDGCVVEVDRTRHRVAYDDVTSARTVFEWGPTPPPGKGSRPGKGARGGAGGRRAKEHARS